MRAECVVLAFMVRQACTQLSRSCELLSPFETVKIAMAV